jgi:ABC-type Fe3+/spermidine/putrescine transport system ATPase subunit
MNSLNLHGIQKSFGQTDVLVDIDLTVEAGTFVTLLGPSGCGKTTLLRIIAGLDAPDSGTVHGRGMTFVDTQAGIFIPPQARELGYVFQDYGLWPHLTVAENVAFPLQMRAMAKADIRERVTEVLGAVQLLNHADKRPEKLSGGQKQRVSIARALAGKPSLMLFDEPLSNLDANLREELGYEIRRLTRELGLTCINVTHDRREAQLLSDSIALMKDGRIHQVGLPDTLFQNPIDVWAATFLDAGNLLPGALFGLDTPTVLVGRSAATVDPTGTLHGLVTATLYIDDRYESLIQVEGHQLKVFTATRLNPGELVCLMIDTRSVRSLSG